MMAQRPLQQHGPVSHKGMQLHGSISKIDQKVKIMVSV